MGNFRRMLISVLLFLYPLLSIDAKQPLFYSNSNTLGAQQLFGNPALIPPSKFHIGDISNLHDLLRNVINRNIRYRYARRLGSEFLGKRSVKSSWLNEKRNELDDNMENTSGLKVQDELFQAGNKSNSQRNFNAEYEGPYDSPEKRNPKPAIIPGYFGDINERIGIDTRFYGPHKNFDFKPKIYFRRQHFGSEFLGRKRSGFIHSDPVTKMMFMKPSFHNGQHQVLFGLQDFPKRGIGMEFLGKRLSEITQDEDELLQNNKVSKKNIGMEFLGRKRNVNHEEFTKKALGREFLGKKRNEAVNYSGSHMEDINEMSEE